MKIHKPQFANKFGNLRKSTIWHAEFVDPSGMPRLLKLVNNRRQSEYLGGLLEEQIDALANGGPEPASLVELLTLLPRKSILQLIDWDIVDYRRALVGFRLVDFVEDFLKDIAEGLMQNRGLILGLKETLIRFFAAMRWFVWADVDIAQAQGWYLALPKYGPRWNPDDNPRESGKVSLNAFIAFADWNARRLGLPENPALPLKALTLSEDEEQQLEDQRRLRRRMPPRRLRRPET